MRFGRLLVALAVLPGIASALGLGEIGDPVFVGEPMSVRVPLLGSDAAGLAPNCVSLRPVPGDFAEKRVEDAVLTVERDALRIRTSRAVTQPLISFRIRIDCGWNLAKDFQLLPYAPRPKPMAPSVAVPVTTAAPIAAEPAPLRPPQAPLPAKLSGQGVAGTGGHLVSAQTTLRLMSRQRYPDDSRARVTFIHRVAAANPELFASVDAAFDQTLPAGTRLTMPDNLPTKRSKSAQAKPKREPDVQSPVARRGEGGGQGRLIIGANDLPTRTAAELNEDLERLIKAVSEQVQIEIAMAERLKKMEADVEQAKAALLQQRAENTRMTRELRELREDLRFSNYVQLVLAILLGGVGVAAVMLWRGQQRVRAPTNIDFAFPAPLADLPGKTAAPTAKPAPLADKPDLDSLFDDLLPKK